MTTRIDTTNRPNHPPLYNAATNGESEECLRILSNSWREGGIEKAAGLFFELSSSAVSPSSSSLFQSDSSLEDLSKYALCAAWSKGQFTTFQKLVAFALDISLFSFDEIPRHSYSEIAVKFFPNSFLRIFRHQPNESVDFLFQIRDEPISDIVGANLLHHAARLGQEDVVAVILANPHILRRNENFVTIDSMDIFGRTPLCLASFLNQPQICSILLKHGSLAINQPTKFGITPLVGASGNGALDVVKILLENGAEVDLPAVSCGCTPLKHAVENGFRKIVELLLDYGSQAIDTPNSGGWTPLNSSCLRGLTEMVVLLLDRGSRALDTPTLNQWYPIHSAVCKGHETIVKELINRNCTSISKCTSQGISALHMAVEIGNTTILQLLLKNGCLAHVNQPISDGTVALFRAAVNGHLGVAEMLINAGANVDFQNRSGRTPLHAAAMASKPDIIRLLCKYGSNSIDLQDNEGWTPLFAASFFGNTITVKALLELGANSLAVRTNAGSTCLAAASEKGNVDTVKTILSHTVGLSLIDSPSGMNGLLPFTFAVLNGHVEVCKALIQFGSRAINVPTIFGTPLFIATNHKFIDIVKYILSVDTWSIDIPSTSSVTPMHAAVSNFSSDILKVLIDYGSNANILQDFAGNTPLHIAANIGNIEAIKLLLSYDNLTQSFTTTIPSSSFQNNLGCTPLGCACLTSNLETIKALLESKAVASNIDLAKNDGTTPFLSAVTTGNTEIVDYLIKNGSKAWNTPSGFGLFPLVEACRLGKEQIVKIIIECLGPSNHSNKNVQKALRYAAGSGSQATYDQIIAIGGDANGVGVLHAGCKGGDTEIVRKIIMSLKLKSPYLLQYRIQQNIDMSSIVALTRNTISSEILKNQEQMLTTRIETVTETTTSPQSSFDQIPIRTSFVVDKITTVISSSDICGRRNEQTEYVILENEFRGSVLHLAVMSKSDICVNLILSELAEVNSPEMFRPTRNLYENLTPLAFAIRTKQKTAVELLVQFDPGSVDVCVEQMKSPLEVWTWDWDGCDVDGWEAVMCVFRKTKILRQSVCDFVFEGLRNLVLEKVGSAKSLSIKNGDFQTHGLCAVDLKRVSMVRFKQNQLADWIMKNWKVKIEGSEGGRCWKKRRDQIMMKWISKTHNSLTLGLFEDVILLISRYF
ncbi:hypothetical protein HK096_008202 [Nowakowskiella sp. JEL0078]|nr:hypothetical protein HK096_008202 [Nowakowskiella sp. JEL0078]